MTTRKGQLYQDFIDAYGRDFDHELNNFKISLLNEMSFPVSPQRLREIYQSGDISIKISVLEHYDCPDDVIERARDSGIDLLVTFAGRRSPS